MTVGWRIFLLGGFFFAVTDLVYWFVSYEEAGTVMLGLCVFAFWLMGGYLLVVSRRQQPGPDDRPDATPADGAGEVGYFPSSSIWPFVMACGAVVVAVGLVFGVWLSLFGATLIAVAVLGYALEANEKV